MTEPESLAEQLLGGGGPYAGARPEVDPKDPRAFSRQVMSQVLAGKLKLEFGD